MHRHATALAAALASALALAATLVAAVPPAPAAAQSFTAQWPDTDFSRSAVDLSTITSGGPPRDGIPAITGPRMITAAAEDDLQPQEAVLTVALPGETPRAYPIRYLMWHEIVNDQIGGRPVAVTYCPLCNSAMVFDRRVEGRVLEFGVSGLLRNSDMVMYDRQTESWWQQATARGIVGEMSGARLQALPAWMESWQAFRAAHPDGWVMAEPDASRRAYGRNPYVLYDRSRSPFFYDGEDPPHGIAPLERVVRVGERAWPFTRLAEAGRIREAGLTLTWIAGLASALEAETVAGGRDVGMVRVQDGLGADVAHDVLFAFAFHAFWPEGAWMLAD